MRRARTYEAADGAGASPMNDSYVSDNAVDALDARVTELLRSERALRHAELEEEARISLATLLDTDAVVDRRTAAAVAADDADGRAAARRQRPRRTRRTGPRPTAQTSVRTLPRLVKKRLSPHVAPSQAASVAVQDVAHDEAHETVEPTTPKPEPQHPPAATPPAGAKAAAPPTQEQVVQVCADLDAALAPADDTLTDDAVAGRLVAVTSSAFAMLERLVLAEPRPSTQPQLSEAGTHRRRQRQRRWQQRRRRRPPRRKTPSSRNQQDYPLVPGLFRACVGALLLAPETLLMCASPTAANGVGTDNADLVRSHIALNMLSLLRLGGPGAQAVPVNDLAGSLCAALGSGHGRGTGPPTARSRDRWWAVLSDDLRILDACTRHVALTCGTSVMEMCDFLAELWLTEEMWCEPAGAMLVRLVGRFAPAPWTDDALLALSEGQAPASAVLGAGAATMGRFLLRLVNVALGRMMGAEATAAESYGARQGRQAGAETRRGCGRRVADFLMRVGPGRSDVGRLVRAALVKLRASSADEEGETALLLEAVARAVDGGGDAYVPPTPLHGVRDARVYMWDADAAVGDREDPTEEEAFWQQQEQQQHRRQRQRPASQQQEESHHQRLRTPSPRSPAQSSSSPPPPLLPSTLPAGRADADTSPDRITRTRTRLTRFLRGQVFPSLGMSPEARLTAVKFRALCERVLPASRRAPSAAECARCIACMDLQGFGTASLEELVTLCTEVLELGPAARTAFGDKSPLHRKLLRLVLEIWQRSLT